MLIMERKGSCLLILANMFVLSLKLWIKQKTFYSDVEIMRAPFI